MDHLILSIYVSILVATVVVQFRGRLSRIVFELDKVQFINGFKFFFPNPYCYDLLMEYRFNDPATGKPGSWLRFDVRTKNLLPFLINPSLREQYMIHKHLLFYDAPGISSDDEHNVPLIRMIRASTGAAVQGLQFRIVRQQTYKLNDVPAVIFESAVYPA